jgi:hypothetical protein
LATVGTPDVGTPFGMDWQFCEGEITEDNIPDIYELYNFYGWFEGPAPL